MSYSLDANVLLYASDTLSPHHAAAKNFMKNRTTDPDLLCVTWLTLMAYQRIATHPAIFVTPLSPAEAWNNVKSLLSLPRVRVIGEEAGFAEDYAAVAKAFPVRGNLVPDAHLAIILREHGVGTIYTSDADFRKFEFLEVRDPLKS